MLNRKRELNVKLRPFAVKVIKKIKGIQTPKYKPPPQDGDKYRILGKWMYVDDKDSLNLTKNGFYKYQETKLIKKLAKKHTVLDIGANIGYFTLLMAKQAKQVYAFEPEPRNFHILQKNIKLNK